MPARTALKAACVSIEPDLEMQLHKAHMADAVHKPTVHLDVFFPPKCDFIDIFFFISRISDMITAHPLFIHKVIASLEDDHFLMI